MQMWYNPTLGSSWAWENRSNDNSFLHGTVFAPAYVLQLRSRVAPSMTFCCTVRYWITQGRNIENQSAYMNDDGLPAAYKLSMLPFRSAKRFWNHLYTSASLQQDGGSELPSNCERHRIWKKNQAI